LKFATDESTQCPGSVLVDADQQTPRIGRRFIVGKGSRIKILFNAPAPSLGIN
jgi:hypothetical protein